MSAALKPVFSSAAVVSRASRIARLAQIISGETTKVDDYVQSNGLPPLSFHPRAPRSCPVPSSAIDIQMSRKAVINATKELQMLMMGPRESMRWDAWRHYDLLSLHFVNKYRIAHIVPLDGDMSFSAISKEIGINEDYVKRFLRHAMTNRIFRESPSGYVAHTTASVTLREDSEISDWIWMQTEESVGLTHRTLDLLERFPASEEPKDAVYPKSKGEDVPMYEIIARDPEKAKRFGRTMHGFTKTQGWEIATLVEHYDWASLGDGTIIDMGGATGFVSAAIAQRYPWLRFIVQDLPLMIKNCESGRSHIPKELLPRIQFQAHNFFTPQPVKGAAVYLFRWILHNWSDKYVVKILENLIPGLEPGSRIVINDICLPEPNTEGLVEENVLRTMDLLALQMMNARERDLQAYKDIFAKADQRFEFVRCHKPHNARMSIIEFKWR